MLELKNILFNEKFPNPSLYCNYSEPKREIKFNNTHSCFQCYASEYFIFIPIPTTKGSSSHIDNL